MQNPTLTDVPVVEISPEVTHDVPVSDIPSEVVPLGSLSTKFQTRDLNQAAFIWCQDKSKLLTLQGQTDGGTTIYFVFELPMDQRDVAALIIRYANGDTLVDPLQFCQKQNQLRDLLYGTFPNNKMKSKGKK